MSQKQIVTTTPAVESKQIVEYKGIVLGEATFGSGMSGEFEGFVAAFTGKRTSG